MTISVRRPNLQLTNAIPKHWYDGEAFASHFFDALSSTFPFGEAFFVRSVMHYREAVREAVDRGEADPELLEQIRDFAGQEGQHSRIHDEHVDLLLAHGYSGLDWLNRNGDSVTRWYNRKLPRVSLATTAALEHMTALLARQMLHHPERFSGRMHPEMAKLWRWHALEEAEHKSVAYDVLEVAVPEPGLRYWHRLHTQAFVSLGLIAEVILRIVYMLHKDGLLFSREGWRGSFRFLLGREGFLRGLGAEYWAWYRRSYHPDDIDDSALVDRRLPEVMAEIAS